MTKEKKPHGNTKQLDWEKLDAILQFGARLLDAQDILGLGRETIREKIKERFDMTFTEYRELRMSKMRMKLLQKQYDVAMSGNVTMLIWLGKQHLKQTEKTETVHKGENVNIQFGKDE